jgi:hypothetical protein
MAAPHPLAGFVPPAFDGARLPNLATTLDAAAGNAPAHPVLADPRLRGALLGSRHLVLWLIDGLGIVPRPKTDAQLIDVLPGKRPGRLVGMHGSMLDADRRYRKDLECRTGDEPPGGSLGESSHDTAFHSIDGRTMTTFFACCCSRLR